MKRKTLFTILFATLAVYGCSSDDGGGAAGSGGSGGSGGTAGSGGSAGSAGEGGAGGMVGDIVYEQDFEALGLMDPAALSGDGWLVFGNVFDPTTGDNIGFYGPFPAPNSAAPTTLDAFSGIEAGEGGAPQGAQQLNIFSDYQNQTAMLAGDLVEANTFQEQTITAGDIGKALTFSFDAKLGNLADSSTASAFIKTIDGTGNLTNFVPFDTTGIPSEWNTYSISLDLTDALLEGQALQYGFSATATNNEPSGVFYDNVKAVTTGP